MLRYLWEYSGLYREVIHTIKYKPSKRLCTAISKSIAESIEPLFPSADWDLIVPIPSSKQALLRRGFNQCAILAAAISVRVGVPWSIFALTHHGYRARQAEVSREKRYSNVRRALRAGTSAAAGKRILLVDDVLTTGATAGVAATALLGAGADAVDLFTIARAGSWSSTRAEIHGKLYPSAR